VTNNFKLSFLKTFTLVFTNIFFNFLFECMINETYTDVNVLLLNKDYNNSI